MKLDGVNFDHALFKKEDSMTSRIILVCAIYGCITFSNSFSQTILVYPFDSDLNPVASGGYSATAYSNLLDVASLDATTGNPAPSVRARNWLSTPTNSYEFEMTLSTGVELSTVSIDYRTTETGPSEFLVSYSIDGMNYYETASGWQSLVRDNGWHSATADFFFDHLPAGDVSFRISARGASSLLSYWWHDNTSVTTIPPPPPAPLMIIFGGPEPETSATNAIPYIDSFESYSDGQDLHGTNAWSSIEIDSLVAESMVYPFSGAYPLPSETHTNVLRVGAFASNILYSTDSHVWVDLMVSSPLSDEVPAYPSEAHSACVLGSDGKLMVYGAWMPETNVVTNAWISMEHAPIAGEEWFRLTYHFAYAADGSNNFFSVLLNETELTHPFGLSLPSSTVTNGAWFLCPNTAAKGFRGIKLMGSGYIDDFVVTDSYVGPTNAYSSHIATAVEIQWPSQYGMKYQVQWCTNLLESTWNNTGDPVYGNGTTNAVFDSSQHSDSRYYRVVTPIE